MDDQAILRIDDFSPNIPVVFLHAHADDEAFLTGGLIHFLSKHGIQTIVIYTAAAIVDSEANTVTRQKEANSACRILGVSEVYYLDFCEPKYHDFLNKTFISQNAAHVAGVIIDLLSKRNIRSPFLLFSYDENGGYGNRDHRLLHLVGREIRQAYSHLVFAAYEATLNRDKLNRWLRDAEVRLGEKSLPKLSYWVKEFGLSNKDIDRRFCLSEESLEVKRRALVSHKTQVKKDEFPLNLSLADFTEVFGTEYYKKVL